MLNEEQLLIRKEKGLLIAKTSRIVKTEKGWKVPSQTSGGYYLVQNDGSETTCTCLDHETRHCKCKHIFAVEYIVTHEVDKDGNITITQTVRKTYTQNWKAYDEATTHQKPIFMKLLKDITDNIEQPIYEFGRPSLPITDMVYGSVMKVFTTFSLRRFMGDMQIAREKNYVDCVPCYASVGHFLQRKDITPLLVKLVILTSLPLTTVETDFAIDSTGYGTNVFQRWFSFKYGKEINSRRWVKCHFMTGVKTNIITGVKITSEFDNDCPELPELVNITAEHFDMNDVVCDKAYLSQNNLKLIDSYEATPYIPFKSNSKARGNGSVWKKMYYLFMLKNDEFLEHYHKRSNAESTVQMIKSKFGDFVRSKTWTAQVNEVLCKIICHNICVIIQEIHELGIEPNFNKYIHVIKL
ncbi:MAG: transposase [Euryarchaeota archaeon]|nr:transposase [Euryarchaeota archaeon]